MERAISDGDLDSADFGILFLSPEVELEEFIPEVHERISSLGADWIGCTTGGEISKEGSSIGGAALLLINSDRITFRTSFSNDIHEDPKKSGKEVIDRITDDGFLDSDKNRIIFLLLAGLTQERLGVEFEVLRGIIEEIGSNIPIVGGSAGDDFLPISTYQFYNGEIYDDALVAVSLETDLPVETGQGHGMDQEVKTGVISSAEGNEIRKISGKTAIEFYSEAIGVEEDKLTQVVKAPFKEKIIAALNYIGLHLKGKNPIILQKVFDYSLENPIAEQLGSKRFKIITPLQATVEGGIINDK